MGLIAFLTCIAVFLSFWGCGIRLLKVSIVEAGQASFPDLVVTSVTNPPASAVAGSSFSVTDTTRNSGNATAGASTTRYRLSLDSTVTSADSLLNGSRSVGTLKKSSSSTGTVTVTIPSGQATGIYYLGACADDLGVVTESNETNNCRASTTTIAVSAPPAISSLLPSSGANGDSISISGSNFGAVQGTSTVKFNGITATPTSWSDTSIHAPVPAGASTGPVVVTVGGVPSNGVTFTVGYGQRVNAAGSQYTDTGGNIWSADQAYSAGSWGYVGGNTASTTDPIANTNDDPLYQAVRWGNFSYKYDLPNGWYDVTLHFAEIYWNAPGQRKFKALIEGSTFLDNYDIYAEVGHDVAATKTFPSVQVQDGQLNIDFVAIVDYASVSAISVLPARPTKLAITSVNSGKVPTAGSGFSVVVQAQINNGVAANVVSATNVSLSVKSGTGTLGGTFTGTIPAGQSQLTINGVTYSKADQGVILTVSRTSGDNLASGDSSPFSVNAGSATNLGFTIQPANATTSSSITGPPTVAVRDSQGNVITSSNASITVAIGNNPGGATLSGTTTKNAVSGVASFPDLRLSQPGTGYTLSASSSGLSGVTSNAFNVASGGSITGTVTRSTGGAINGALVEALQSGAVKGTGAAGTNGTYTISGLVPGTYDVRGSAGGFSTQTQTGISVTSGGTATVNFSLTATSPTSGITYIYDELQRLKAVVDPIGEAATYGYDAVGNLLSTSRYDASQVSIIDFTPDKGPVGTTVTIHGTGYSTTPSQNTVTFNGASATVTSSTLTQIVTSVPAGATSGPIGVTTPNGSTTSSTSFTVSNAPGGSPTITNFSPNIGVAGTAVIITGTNFDTTPANNEVRFNPTLAAVSTSALTTINTTAPIGGRSGRISVSTATGTATSTQDFYSIPSPYAVADVGYSNRMSIGGTLTVNVPTNKVAMVLFDGTAGQRVNLGMTGSTLACTDYRIYQPNNTQIASALHRCNSNEDLEDFLLPATGTHAIIVDPEGANTGAVTLTLSHDVMGGTIVPDGPPVNVNIALSGQRERFTFSGSAGQRVSLYVSNVLFGSTCLHVSILKPDGSTLGSPVFACSPAFLDTQTLPEAGTYTVLANPPSAGTGTATIQLYDVAGDIGGSIAIDGASVPVTITDPGQNASLTFTGSEGQRLNVGVNSSTVNGYVNLYRPNGSFWTNITTGTGQHLDVTIPIGGTGSYTLKVDPVNESTGTITLTLSEEINGGTIVIGGASVPMTIDRIGQRGYMTFSGTAGQRLNIGVNSSTVNGYVNLHRPDGSFWTNITTGTGQHLDVTIPTGGTGSYMILIDSAGTSTGTITLTLSEEIDAGPIVVNGASVPMTIARVGQRGYVTFNGTQGQQVTVRVSANTMANVSVALLKPDLTVLTSNSSGSGSFELTTQTLPTAGTYTILVDPNGTTTGSLNLNVTSP